MVEGEDSCDCDLHAANSELKPGIGTDPARAARRGDDVEMCHVLMIHICVPFWEYYSNRAFRPYIQPNPGLRCE